MAAVTITTNSGIKQHKFIIMQFRRPEVQHRLHRAEVKVSAGPYFSPEARGQNLFPYLFQLPEATHIP